MTSQQSPSLTSCIRYHEAGHAVMAYRLGGTIEYVGAKGRAAHMRLPNRQWVEHEGICLIRWFGDYENLVYPVAWDAPACDHIVKDVAVLLGGIWAHKHYAGISFETAADMGGHADLALVGHILALLPAEYRDLVRYLARWTCSDILKKPESWCLVEGLAKYLKKHPVLPGDTVHLLLGG